MLYFKDIKAAFQELYLWQVFGNVTPNKHSLQIDPQVLHYNPLFNDLRRRRKIEEPVLYLCFVEGTVPIHSRQRYVWIRTDISENQPWIITPKIIFIITNVSGLNDLLQLCRSSSRSWFIIPKDTGSLGIKFMKSISNLKSQNFKLPFVLFYLLLISEPSTIRLSSRLVRISDVSAPFSINSPLFLNVIKLRVWPDHSSFTCDNLASISFSFIADMQMSYKCKKPGCIHMNK